MESESVSESVPHYVRKKGVRGRFVEFDYAVGSPDLAMELIMPQEMFADFCERFHPIMMDGEAGEAIDLERAQWRYGTKDIETIR